MPDPLPSVDGGRTSRVLASLFGGLLAASIGNRLGLPIWETWRAGDQVDLFVLTFTFVYFALAALTPNTDRG